MPILRLRTLRRGNFLLLFALIVLSCSLGSLQVSSASAAGNQDWDLAIDADELPSSPVASPRAAQAIGDPEQNAQALAQLLAAQPNDSRTMAGAATQVIGSTWSESRGVYVTRGQTKVRVQAEMLITHASAALAGRSDQARQDARIEPLVMTLTGPTWLPNLSVRKSDCPSGKSKECWHQFGWVDMGVGATMHRSRDAVAMRALAAAWKARDIVGLSQQARDRIKATVNATGRSEFWRPDKRLFNQINWNADITSAYVTVTGDTSMWRKQYRPQLKWLIETATKRRSAGYKAPNFTPGMGFRYNPYLRVNSTGSRQDTIEYSNIVFGALAYYDTARAGGMRALKPTEIRVLREWAKHLAYGAWSSNGYLNWDTAHGINRVHLTQYWLLSARGFLAGLQGTFSLGLLNQQAEITRGLLRSITANYQRRAKAAGSVILPPVGFGFTGTALFDEAEADGVVGTARFAAIMSELADRGLTQGNSVVLRPGGSWDKYLGRLAIETPRYQTAIVTPSKLLRSGGLEPARILNNAAQPVTSMGGTREGTLGLSLSTAKGALLLDTQPGITGSGLSKLKVSGLKTNSANSGKNFRATGQARRGKLNVELLHVFRPTRIETIYRVKNGLKRSVLVETRVPTYGVGANSSLNTAAAPSLSQLSNSMFVRSTSGASFNITLNGFPANSARKVVRPLRQLGNPQPGPEIKVRFLLRGGKSRTLRRVLTVRAPD